MSTSILESSSVMCFSMLSLLPIVATISDTLTTTQTLKVGKTLVSASGLFELGFFSPQNSSIKLYLGIWYKRVPERTVVWVANRDRGIKSPAVLKISGNGNLIVYRGSTRIWSSNQRSSTNTVAQLLDSGNFVLRSTNDSDPTNFLWQSFDYPTNTLLPGMKLGWDSKTGLNRYLNSWKSSNDPSPGDYSFKFDMNGFPELYLRNKEVIRHRLGPWNGVRFSGFPETTIFNFSFLMNPNEVTYSFEILDKSTYSQLFLNPFGVLQRYTWTDSDQGWKLFWYVPEDQCDSYKECGAFGVCGTDYSPVCQCVRGFKPQNQKAWSLRHGSGGCVSVSKSGCGGDGFLVLKGMKLPVMATAVVNGGMSLIQCEKACLMNCSCSAFSIMDIKGGGSNCLIWIGDLIDMRQYSAGKGGQDLFVRVVASDLEEAGRIVSRKNFEEISLMIGLTVAAAVVLVGLGVCFAWKRKGIQRALEEKTESKRPHETSQDVLTSDGIAVSNRHYSGENPSDELEILLFDFGSISIATNNFSEENKLGEGGFGCVYKGILVDGQEVAVKRLSMCSGQGTEQFKNEVRLIARVQHRNLVRLLGCCIRKEEKMLIYEHMKNRSLDSILFDPMKCSTLNWKRRFNIICGIARGLLYLHQDSRFRIIHRDLKVSNILLDGEMNPKISDFGMARIFGGDQTEENTARVVGTFGYMSPEYVRAGIFSVKSDVFSFGVLLLEIISGKKNRRFYNAQQGLALLEHAWWLWEQGKGIELLDTSAGESYTTCEVMRCIQVALLCVQQRAEDRPSMSSVVLMLSSNEAASMSQPKLPGFSIGRGKLKTLPSIPKKCETFSINELTITNLEGR